MFVQQHLLDLGDLFNFSDLSTFTQNIPVEWVASVLDLSTQATLRRRRLLPIPPEQISHHTNFHMAVRHPVRHDEPIESFLDELLKVFDSK